MCFIVISNQCSLILVVCHFKQDDITFTYVIKNFFLRKKSYLGVFFNIFLEAGGRFLAYLAICEGTEILNMIHLPLWSKAISTDFLATLGFFSKIKMADILGNKTASMP